MPLARGGLLLLLLLPQEKVCAGPLRLLCNGRWPVRAECARCVHALGPVTKCSSLPHSPTLTEIGARFVVGVDSDRLNLDPDTCDDEIVDPWVSNLCSTPSSGARQETAEVAARQQP